ncbi:hypothetical protein [Deinococcus sp. LM3]|nr:hypothetical protein [Deinococcus sp. LM3]
MSVTRFIGRALLASIFIKNGLDHLQNPDPIVRAARGPRCRNRNWPSR